MTTNRPSPKDRGGSVHHAVNPPAPDGDVADEMGTIELTLETSLGAPIDRETLASALTTLLNKADPQGITEVYIAARLEELARPGPAPNFWRRFITTVHNAVALGCTAALVISGLAATVLSVAWWLTASPVYGLALCGTLVITAFNSLVVSATGSWPTPSDGPPGPPLDPSAQVKVILTELQALHGDLTKTVQAKNSYGVECIKHSTTRQRYELERATEEAKTADQLARKAKFEQQAVPSPIAPAVLALQAEARERARARVESEKPENRRAEEAAAAEHRRNQEAAEAEHRARLAAWAAEQAEYERQARPAEEADDADVEGNPRAEESAAAENRRAEELADAEHRVALAALAQQQTEHEQRASKKAADSATEEVITPAKQRADELAAAEHAVRLEEIEHQRAINKELLAGRIRGLNDPSTSGSRRAQRRRLEQQQHRLELAQIDAEVVSHRTRAKLLRERPMTEEEQFLRRAKERLRSTLNKSRVISQASRDGEAYLLRIAREHGDDSEQYREAAAMLDAALMDLRDEADQPDYDNQPKSNGGAA